MRFAENVIQEIEQKNITPFYKDEKPQELTETRVKHFLSSDSYVLSNLTKNIFIEYYQNEKTLEQISEEYGLSISNVRNRLRTAQVVMITYILPDEDVLALIKKAKKTKIKRPEDRILKQITLDSLYDVGFIDTRLHHALRREVKFRCKPLRNIYEWNICPEKDLMKILGVGEKGVKQMESVLLQFGIEK